MESDQPAIDPQSKLATPLDSDSSTPSRANSFTSPTAPAPALTPISIPRSQSLSESRPGTRSRSSSGQLTASHSRTQRACTFCQKKKTKCDGRKPKCGFCVRSGVPCVYGTSKRENNQLHVRTLEQKLGAYESLLRDLVSRSTGDGRQLLEEAIQAHFHASPEFFSTLLSTPSLVEQEIHPSRPGLSLARMHQAWQSNPRNEALALLKEPPVRVTSIQHWTTLVDDDVASHLLSLYFTWENPTWQLIDRTLFVHDLNHRGSRFCSSLLVHTLLFFGCSFSYNLDRITNRREEKVLGEKLYAVIQRLWLQKQNSTDIDLPTIQSSVLIGLLCCTFGIDKVGTNYIMRGAAMSAKMGLDREDCEYFACREGDDAQALQNCQKFVSWAVYDIQALACQVYRKPPTWKGPPPVQFSLEEATVLDQGGQWTPYPFSTPVSEPFFYAASSCRSNLVAIVNDIARFALKFPASVLDEADWTYGKSLYQRLLDWNASLPWNVLPRYNATPHIICLHLHYQATILSLCEIFLLNASTSSPTPKPSIFSPTVIKPLTLDSLATLILLYKSTHGFKSIPVVMLHYFCLGGIHSIPKLSPDGSKWSLVLECSVLGLWYMSLGWGRLCRAFLRTIDLVLKASKPDERLVPDKVRSILSQLNGHLWTENDTEALAADYVVYHVPGTGPLKSNKGSGELEGKGAHALQDLLLAMEGLDVAGS
ncbi:hypothetical protein BDV18DRAFT_155674 [Aspergillus unguis]